MSRVRPVTSGPRAAGYGCLQALGLVGGGERELFEVFMKVFVKGKGQGESGFVSWGL